MLVTCALPYANGSIHLGHILEHIQADIWVRYQRMRGNRVIMVCADDTHGTPIMIKAKQLHMTPEEMITKIGEEHRKSFAGFLISYDNFYTTHSPENRELSERLFLTLKEKGYIKEKTISQLYDEKEKMFLPDRFVKGTCPRCHAEGQYGDNCEVCGATYSPSDLINPVSVVSGTTPVEKQTTHYFFDLPQFGASLHEWVKTALPVEMVNKIEEWFEQGLQMWDITRDSPYFGFKIPGTDDKFFYVWLDAPVGYLGSFKNFCSTHPDVSFEDFVKKDSPYEMYHFIGKDILYFHSLFWPAMLEGANLRRPTKLFIHGYVTVNGSKMSKSRGTFIKADTFLRHFPAETLRYYYAAKMNSKIDDIDFNLDDFVKRVNADIVNKLVNLAARSAGFLTKSFGGMLSARLPDPALYRKFADARESIGNLIDSREYSRAVREIMELADEANRYVDETAPWVEAKKNGATEHLQEICTQAVNMFRALMTFLKPVLPEVAANAEKFLNTELTWDSVAEPLISHKINQYKALFTRIDKKATEAMIEDSKADLKAQQAQTASAENKSDKDKKNEQKKKESAPAGIISFDDFAKVSLKTAKVLSCEAVEGSDKLLRFSLDFGNGDVRNVFSGIKEFYKPEDLVGKIVVAVANLAPRKMRFGMSESMILAACGDDGKVSLVFPDDGAAEGMTVR